MDSLLSLRKFGVRFGKKTILSSIDLDISDCGINVLMGPSGTGKSTLLRSIAGFNNASSLYASHGEVIYAGEPIGSRGFPILVEQKLAVLASTAFENIIHTLNDRHLLNRSQQIDLVKRILSIHGLNEMTEYLDISMSELDITKRRIISILSALINAPPLIMIDEPTSGVDDEGSERILNLIKSIGKQHSLIVVLHNQKHARKIADKISLLAGGVIQETATKENFFHFPASTAAKEFIRSGSCAVPSPDARSEDLNINAKEIYQPVKHLNQSQKPVPYGPQGFKWIIRDKLSASPRPGLLRSLGDDINALKKVKISHLISLEEELHYPESYFLEQGITVLSFPIIDMKAPEPDAALKLIENINRIIHNGGIVNVHCRAGLGRTGTILACFLISTGMKQEDALHAIRSHDPRMIQTKVQEDFLQKYTMFTLNQNKQYGKNHQMENLNVTR